jgi:hypothetical protein
MPSDARYVGQNASVSEHHLGSQMCKTIQLTGISMFVIIIIIIILLVLVLVLLSLLVFLVLFLLLVLVLVLLVLPPER